MLSLKLGPPFHYGQRRERESEREERRGDYVITGPRCNIYMEKQEPTHKWREGGKFRDYLLEEGRVWQFLDKSPGQSAPLRPPKSSGQKLLPISEIQHISRCKYTIPE